MAIKKDNLPLTLDNDGDATSTITYANEVIAIIAGVAANEVEGVAGMSSSGGGISDVFGRNKNITKGVRVEIGTEEASVDLYLIIEYGTPIQTAASNVQENVRKAIESMTGLHVVRVDVHVQGVSFEKENKEALVGLESLSEGEKSGRNLKQEARTARQKADKADKADAANKAEADKVAEANADKAAEADKPSEADSDVSMVDNANPDNVAADENCDGANKAGSAEDNADSNDAAAAAEANADAQCSED